MTELLIFWTVVLVIAGALAAISDIFDDRDGERTLAIVRTLLADHRTTSEGRS